VAQAKERSIIHHRSAGCRGRRGSSTKPRLASSSLIPPGDAVRLGGVGGLLPRVALVDIGRIDALAGRCLNRFGHVSYGSTVIDTGRGDVQRQQMSQRVDRQMQLSALLALDAVMACPLTAFRR
jgi:hypothetical protein